MFRIGQEEKDAVARVIDSKELFKVNDGNLQETANFEKELRELFDMCYCTRYALWLDMLPCGNKIYIISSLSEAKTY